VLPTPISSFTAVAASATDAQALRDSPLLATLGNRMQTRVATQAGAGQWAPPGMPVIATGTGSAEAAQWQLRHGAVQLLCLPPTAPVPNHVVIHTLDAAARRATLAVAASLLRHVPAEAIYLAIQPEIWLEKNRAANLRDLLDVRSEALAEHGLDMRTELRPGALLAELQRELAAYAHSMLVLGTSDPEAIEGELLTSLLEANPQSALLIVNAARAETAVEA
jgi:hypothetical protein